MVSKGHVEGDSDVTGGNRFRGRVCTRMHTCNLSVWARELIRSEVSGDGRHYSGCTGRAHWSYVPALQQRTLSRKPPPRVVHGPVSGVFREWEYGSHVRLVVLFLLGKKSNE